MSLPIFEPDEDLLALEGEQLAYRDAVKLIAERLIQPRVIGTEDKYHFSRQARTKLAAFMVSMLDERAWTAEALSQVDLRQLLQPIATTEYGAANDGLQASVVDPNIEGQQIELTAGLRELALAEYVDLRKRMKDQLEADLFEFGSQLPEGVDADSIPMYVDELLRETERHDKNRVSAGPVLGQPAFTGQTVTDPTTGQTAVMGTNGAAQDFLDMIGNISSGDTGEQYAFMSDRDVQFMFRQDSPDMAMDAYFSELGFRDQVRQTGAQAPGDTLNVNLDGIAPSRERPRAQVDTSNIAGIEDASSDFGRSYKLSQALNLPFSMSRQEIARLTTKMEKAGLFAQIDGGAPTIKGDPTDPQFKKAYRLLLSKSIQEGKPTSTVLQTSMAAYEEMRADQLQMSLSDPSRVRIASDALSRNILGRKATAQEQAQLVKLVHNWERSAAEQAFDMQTEDKGGEVTEVDWEARLEETIRNQNPDEAGAKDVQRQFDVFQGLLAGPGRGM